MHGTLDKLYNEISPWLHEFVRIATSWWAQRAYVVVAAIVITAISFWIAQRQRSWLIGLSPGNFDRSFQGPHPTRKKTIEKQLGQLRDFKNSMMRSALSSLGLLFLFGLAVPSAMAILGMIHYSWFNPSGHLLVDEHSRPLTSPSVAESFWFLASQSSLGVVGSPASFAGAFGAKIADVSFDHANAVSDIIVFGYREFLGLFAGVLTHFLLTLGRVVSSTGPKELELNAALAGVSGCKTG